MYPHERSLVQNLAGKPFALVGVNSDKNKEELKTVMTKEQITWRSFWDADSGSIAKRFKIRGWPSLYVIDHKGAIRYKFVGSPGDVKEAESRK
jgi:hypothetical protein